MKDEDPEEERSEFYAIQVTLLNCTGGNYDHATGEPASIVTIARKDVIEPLIFRMDDARKLVTKLLGGVGGRGRRVRQEAAG